MNLMVRSAVDAIKVFYGDRCARRSGVPLINHIHEGLRIMKARDASDYAQAAYALHPIFQDDASLTANFGHLQAFDPRVVALVVEYRHVANAWLSGQVYIKRGASHYDRPPKLSPLHDVNEMLVADKVQNRADFVLHHKHKHPRSGELDLYFTVWLDALKISHDEYERLVRVAKRP